MWYVSSLLFVKPAEKFGDPNIFETCDVLLQSTTSAEAYEKSLLWANEHLGESSLGFRFVGIEALRSLDDERPGDGSELGGRFYESIESVEDCIANIPQRYNLTSVAWEYGSRTLADLLNEEQIKILKKLGSGNGKVSGTDSP